MAIKKSNEITVKVLCSISEAEKILLESGYQVKGDFFLDDYYFVPNNLDLNALSSRDILSKAVIIRNIINGCNNLKMIVYKIKKFADNGDIIDQKAINCSIVNMDEAKKLLKAMGYKEILNIKENSIIYNKDDFELVLKNVVDGDLLIEAETEENGEYDTTDKIKAKIASIKLPLLPNEYFIKKAEVALNKALDRK